MGFDVAFAELLQPNYFHLFLARPCNVFVVLRRVRNSLTIIIIIIIPVHPQFIKCYLDLRPGAFLSHGSVWKSIGYTLLLLRRTGHKYNEQFYVGSPWWKIKLNLMAPLIPHRCRTALIYVAWPKTEWALVLVRCNSKGRQKPTWKIKFVLDGNAILCPPLIIREICP